MTMAITGRPSAGGAAAAYRCHAGAVGTEGGDGGTAGAIRGAGEFWRAGVVDGTGLASVGGAGSGAIAGFGAGGKGSAIRTEAGVGGAGLRGAIITAPPAPNVRRSAIAALRSAVFRARAPFRGRDGFSREVIENRALRSCITVTQPH